MIESLILFVNIREILVTRAIFEFRIPYFWEALQRKEYSK